LFPPYCDHDAFLHHAIHVLHASAVGDLQTKADRQKDRRIDRKT